MKSTFIGTVLFAVAIVNQVSAVKPQPGDGSVYVDQATLDKYYDECEDLTVDTCANSPHCEVLRSKQHAVARLILCTE